MGEGPGRWVGESRGTSVSDFVPVGGGPGTYVFNFVRRTYCRNLLFSAMSVSSSSSCCFVRATGVLSSSARMLSFLQPSLFHLLAPHSSEHLSFVLFSSCFFSSFFFFHFSFFFLLLSFSFFFFFQVFSLFLFSLFSWPGLFCCVIVPGTLAFHLLYLDKLQLCLVCSVSQQSVNT